MTTKEHRNKNIPVQFTGIIYLLLVAFVVGTMLSCIGEDQLPEEKERDNLMVRLDAVSQSYLDNTHIFLFNKSDDKFNHKQTGVQKDVANSCVTMSMRAGNWNLVVLSCNQLITSDIIYPDNGIARKDTKMWVMQESSQGILLDMPEEFRYALIENVNIQNEQDHQYSAVLERNVGKIQVVLSESLAIGSGTHNTAFAELHDVPNTLAWDGGLYPGKGPSLQNPLTPAPDVSTKPMKKLFNFDAQGNADVLEFIVPAHRGVNANDTTTHKISMRVCLPISGQSDSGMVEIPYVPQPNKIIRVTVEFNSTYDLDIKVSVKDWVSPQDQTVRFTGS